jgi:predicted aconitase with swiveling domain
MKKSLLNKHNLELAKLCAKDESRYALSGIQITERETVVTDGHILARVTLPDIEPEHFPTITGLRAGAPVACAAFIMPKDAALSIAKAIPVGRKRGSIPILSNAILDSVTEESGAQFARVGVTDLENPQVFNAREIAGQFPNVDLVCPKRQDARFKVSFDLRLLIPLLQQMNSFLKSERVSTVQFSFYGDEATPTPMRIDAHNPDTGQNFMGVIMPIRQIGDGSEYNYPGFDVLAEVTATDVREIEAEEWPEMEMGEQAPDAQAAVLTAVDDSETDAGADFAADDTRDECEIMAERAAVLLMSYNRFTVSPFARDLWQAIMVDFAELMEWAVTGDKWSYPDDCEAQLDQLARRIASDAEIIAAQPMMAGAILNAESAPPELVAA